MRRWSALLVATMVAAFALASSPARSAVLISELCDPLSNFTTDRYIEIANSGPDTVDLTNWALIAVANLYAAPPLGNIHTWALSGTLAPGQAKVAGNSSTVAVFTVDFPSATWSSSNSTWNGQRGDGAKLIGPGGAVVDSVVMPSAGLVFSDGMYVRKPTVYAPNPAFTSSEWTFTAVTLASGATPGTHVFAPRPPGPSISAIVTVPSYPLAGVAVDVQANVVDTASAITAVSLAWGTAPASLTNTVPMALVAGSTYGTTAPIPAQSAGTVVYYKVSATDAASGASTSDLKSYALAYDLAVAQIQGTGATSPYAGAEVITHGVVTGVFGLYFTVQDGSGARNGLWARSSAPPGPGDDVIVRGTVTETDAQGYAGNTLLASAVVMSATPGGTLPAAVTVASGAALAEAYEGVLVRVAGGVCTDPDAGSGHWVVNDGSGFATVDTMGYAFVPLLGTTYDVTGPVNYHASAFVLVPRDAADVVWVADNAAPVVNAVGEMSDSTFLVQFSEPVALPSAEDPSFYSIAGHAGVAATRDALDPSHVLVTVRDVPAGPVTLNTTGVQDPYGNATAGATRSFTYIDVSVPAGYYAAATGLHGTALRAALQAILAGHTVYSYDYAYTAFQTTDVKPNGKVWDVYSDIPGGIAPYEYEFGDNPGSGNEGSGYNREHSWPQAWFGGASPMYTDLWILYPTDAKVNEYRGNFPYGEVGVATITSMNGSKLGPSVTPGYAGTVFEPIDAFKGDLARSNLYVATRYFGEDAGWPGSESMSGADPLPWTSALFVEWNANDPVSWKERLRNGAVYALQGNRNPFVDHPEWVAAIYDSSNVAAVDDTRPLRTALLANAPNPFRGATTLRFDLARADRVALHVFDVSGRRVRTLAAGRRLEPGHHGMTWDGRDDGGHPVGAGVYFYRLATGDLLATRRMVVLR